MADEEEFVDLYAVLGLENTKEKPLTAKEISKTYRRLALKYHPDKQKVKEGKDYEAAVTKFDLIAKANEILQDEKERAKFDQRYFAKMAIRDRHRALDAKTRKMTEELNTREKEFRRKRKQAIDIEILRKHRMKEVKASDDLFIEAWLQRQQVKRGLHTQK
mmetsp:Transcript_13325/g.15232  ORF Transcript_13325/g.15232 Transcript_13325/m.15232 type:complete len:161 (+) Transcript_13325:551-1033(+)|eukprot:CAMPEP_0184011204 /NCGR_PEP_ID=MMETSP0954-20121128/3687_1 /TAXON_ID=627963 /ORGANISM="Aplanochytrium sp, Strain PBS07" /LENGTH=160 /DNA_ID=CAMNT_0026290975 /DNA_START=371 /DNA_END=853 /DNA_ORIENTATION=-